MPATMFRQEDRRLAGPTEALSAQPDRLLRAAPEPIDQSDGDDLGGITAIVDQATSLAERNPDSPAAKARLAHALLGAGRVEDARRVALEVAAGENPAEDAPALLAAVAVLLAAGDSAAAENALALLGGRRFPHLFARLAADRKEWDTALARLEGSLDAPSQELRGWIELQRHRYRDAVVAFRSLIASRGSGSPDLYINLGYAYAALGSLGKAIRSTKTALALSPDSRTAGFNLSAFYMAAGSFSDAVRVLDTIRQRHPKDLAPFLAIASAYARCGDLDAAERELRRAKGQLWGTDKLDRARVKANLVALRQAKRAITTADSYSQVRSILEEIEYGDLGIARLLLPWMHSTHQADKAEELAHELGRRFPAETLGAFRTQAALLKLDIDAAVIEAQRWGEDEPFDPAAATNLTYLLTEGSIDFERAVQVGCVALRRFPSDVTLRNNVAYALIQLNRLDAAAKVLSFAPCMNDPVCLATLGLLGIRQGKVEDGLNLYEMGASTAEGSNADLLAYMIRRRAAAEAARVGRTFASPADPTQADRADAHFVLSLRRTKSLEEAPGCTAQLTSG